MIVVHFNFRMAENVDKKKKKAIKKKDGNAEGGPAADDSDDNHNKITYFPKLVKIEKFF